MNKFLKVPLAAKWKSSSRVATFRQKISRVELSFRGRKISALICLLLSVFRYPIQFADIMLAEEEIEESETENH